MNLISSNYLRKTVSSVCLGCFISWLGLAGVTYEPYTITTIAGDSSEAGSEDGTGSNARFNGPVFVARDGAGNLFVSDIDDHTIRKMTLVETNWVVTTVAGAGGVAGSEDGAGSDARFNWPTGLTVDGAGNLYVVDGGNNTIRKVTPVGTNWVVTTLLGEPGSADSNDGTGSVARLWSANDPG
jgi:hypothetical protein